MVICFLFKDIKDGWDPDLPNDIDAAVTWKGRNHFFKGCTAYTYGGKGLNKIVRTDDIPTIWKVPCKFLVLLQVGEFIYIYLKVQMFTDGPTRKIVSLKGHYKVFHSFLKIWMLVFNGNITKLPTF